jgi:hypothetical protein
VMASRSNSSITINVDRRGAADADIQVKRAGCAACCYFRTPKCGVAAIVGLSLCTRVALGGSALLQQLLSHIGTTCSTACLLACLLACLTQHNLRIFLSCSV